MKGLVHIYTGDGKGKTTAAVGLGIRAFGRGFRVLMVQFLKGADTGEIETISRLGERFVVRRTEEIKKFTWQMTPGELQQAKEKQQELFDFARSEAAQGNWDLIILDEIMAAINTGMIATESVEDFVRSKPEKLELVLTGRNAPEALINLADYVSDIRAVKHPMERGVPSRPGIEF